MNVGVLGGGQLGRMLAQAGAPLGMRFRFLDPKPEACAHDAGECLTAAYDDEEAIRRFVDGLDVVTYEFENVPLATLEKVAEFVPAHPGPNSLRASLDRLAERQLFEAVGMMEPTHEHVHDMESLEEAVSTVGAPAVLKRRRGGYDGRGQVFIEEASQAQRAWAALDRAPCMYEEFISFDREVSLVAVRDRRGEMRFYPLVENEHQRGVLFRTLAPAPEMDAHIQKQAETDVAALMDALDHVGVLTVEFFQCGDLLLANEMAARVHNSGHWSIEGAVTSQFENHLRALAGLPLGDTSRRGAAVMWNLIGGAPASRDMLAVPGAHLHLYGKSARAGRKIGHVTLTAESHAALQARRQRLCDLILKTTVLRQPTELEDGADRSDSAA